MHENHITYFKVENFKRFEHLEVDNIGQFNLLVGGNNVGKTSLLELLLVDEALMTNSQKLLTKWGKDLADLADQKLVRINFDDLLPFHLALTNETIGLRIVFGTAYTTNNVEVLTFSFSTNNNKIEPPSFKDLFDNDRFFNRNYGSKPFMSFYEGYHYDLPEFYKNKLLSNRTLKHEIFKAFKVLVPGFITMELEPIKGRGGHHLVIEIAGYSAGIRMHQLGEGAIKLFRILYLIVTFKGKRIMIDEIDAGIHHSRFKPFWKVILLTAKAHDVQIFATTHNMECIQFFEQVLEELTEEEGGEAIRTDSRVISLAEVPDNGVEAFVYDYEQFSSVLETNLDIRGGK